MVLVCFAWIFFRSHSFSDACYIVTHLFVDLGLFKAVLFQPRYLVWLAVLAFLAWLHRLERPNVFLPGLAARPLALRWAVYYLFVLGIILYGFKPSQFIYFQF